MNFKESSNLPAHLLTSGPIRRNGRNQHYHAVARQQLRDEPNPPDILIASILGESEVFAETLAHLIPVKVLDRVAESS